MILTQRMVVIMAVVMKLIQGMLRMKLEMIFYALETREMAIGDGKLRMFS